MKSWSQVLFKMSNLIAISDIDAFKEMLLFEQRARYSNRSWFPYMSSREVIEKRVVELEPPEYTQPLVMSEQEVVNGFRLYDETLPLMRHSVYCTLPPLYVDGPDMSFETFKDRLDEITCTEWHKRDEHGEYFEGYWRYPAGSLEKTHAFQLTYDRNRRLLYKLPYSKEFILKTVEFGCDNGWESVRYSNHICEWVRRKQEQLTPK